MPRRAPVFHVVARAPRLVPLAAGAALAGAVLGACGERPVPLDQLQRFEGTERLGAEADTAAAWRPTAQDPVTVTLTLPARAAAGQPVPVRVRLRNGSRTPVSVGLGEFQDVEVVVARVDKPARQGAVFGPMQMQNQRANRGAVVTDPIRAGRDSVFEVQWPQTDDLGHRVPPGQYRVRAVVNAQLVARQRLWTAWDTVTVGQ